MTVCKRKGKNFNKAIKLAVTIATLGMFIACGDDSGSSAPELTSESIESTDTDLVVKTFDDLPVCSNKREGSTAYVKEEKVAYVCEDGDWTPDSDENVDKKSSSSGKASSSSNKKTQSSSSNDKAKSSSSGKASSSSSMSETSSSSGGKETSSSSFKYEQDSSAYVQPKVVAVKNKSISGVSQKGPFVTGSTVKLYELDGKTFAQTGKSFSGKITSDDGKFSVSSVSLASQYASLEATGYFRNEVTGEKSKGTITLNALTDLSDRKNVNINLLTHLEYERVLHLIESGINFTAAKKQAEAEILNAFGIKGEFANSEDLDIFGKGDDNAALLAFSVLMLGGAADEYGDYKELSEAELTERLTKFATDIAKDGSWDDEKTKVAIADWAAMYSQYEAYDDYYSDYNESSYIRQSIEKWNLGTVPNFEKYVRNFWVSIYGLGKCDSKNEGTVVATRNKLSNTFGSNVRFICKDGVWKHASDIEKDTYQWAAGKDGEIKAGDITKRNYDYDGKLKKWRYAIGAEIDLGGCTEAREKDYSQNTGKIKDFYLQCTHWYICKNREWQETDSMTVDTQAWGKGDDGELRKGDSTVAIYKYDEAEQKWLIANYYDTLYKLNGCTTNRIYEISKSSVDDEFYVCDSVIQSATYTYNLKDSVIMKWREATWQERDVGVVCTETREKDIRRIKNGNWYICKSRKWESISSITVDTLGWNRGKDGELRKGDSTGTVYKYDETKKEWLTANERDTTLKLNGCTTNRDGEIHKVNGVWYICLIGDDYMGRLSWILPDTITVDTYGWPKGKDGELRKGDSTDAFYKYDEYMNRWLAATYKDTVLELNGCTNNRKGEVGKSSLDDTYYICMYNGSPFDWREATEIEYNTYGGKCSATEVGKRMDGMVTKTNKYYCTEKGWIRITEDWSWDVPKEARLNPEITYSTMTDSRDNKVYKTIKIGNQVWMAENLNYADSAKTRSLLKRSWCYKYKCDVTGRFYTWSAAIDSVALATDKNNPQDCGYLKPCTLPTKVQGICPNGWHLPSWSEWETLISTVGEKSIAGKILKSQTGWYKDGDGTDNYGFSAVPAGYKEHSNNYISYVGERAVFWSATEVPTDAKADYDGDGYYHYFNENGYFTYVVSLHYENGYAYLADDNYKIKIDGLSVRCLQD